MVRDIADLKVIFYNFCVELFFWSEKVCTSDPLLTVILNGI